MEKLDQREMAGRRSGGKMFGRRLAQGERAAGTGLVTVQRGNLGISNTQLCLQVSMHLFVDQIPMMLDKR